MHKVPRDTADGVVQVGHNAGSEWRSGDVKGKVNEKNEIEMRDASRKGKVMNSPHDETDGPVWKAIRLTA